MIWKWYEGSVAVLFLPNMRHQTAPQTSRSFPLPPRLSSGRHPDHHQPAAQVPAAVGASSEEAHLQRHVLLPQAQQDSLHLDAAALLLLLHLHLEFRRQSGQNPIPLEGLVKTGERGTVWQIMNSEWSSCMVKRSHKDTFNSVMNNRATTDNDLSNRHLPVHISLRGWAFLKHKLWQPETLFSQHYIWRFSWDCKYRALFCNIPNIVNVFMSETLYSIHDRCRSVIRVFVQII